MNNDSLDIQLYDFMDLLNFTLSTKFIDKYKYKFSKKFLLKFQYKLLHHLDKRKKIRKSTLYTYLSKGSGYSTDQVDLFFETIEIEIYRPFIS